MSSGVAGNMVLPSFRYGIPALGWAIKGRYVTLLIASTALYMPSMPRLQFAPITSAPSPSATMANTSGGVPNTVRIVSSNVIVATTGSPDAFAAMIAAFISRMSIIVSIIIKSTPPSLRASTCSENISTASSKDKSPTASRNLPVGPRPPATRMVRSSEFVAVCFYLLTLDLVPASLKQGSEVRAPNYIVQLPLHFLQPLCLFQRAFSQDYIPSA